MRRDKKFMWRYYFMATVCMAAVSLLQFTSNHAPLGLFYLFATGIFGALTYRYYKIGKDDK